MQLNEYCLCELESGRDSPVLWSRESGSMRRPISIGAGEAGVANLFLDVEVPGLPKPIKLRVSGAETVRDLVPKIANHSRQIQIYTDHYSFSISEADQARLMLMSPIVEPTWTLGMLDVKELKMQKKVFADVAVPAPPVVPAVEPRPSASEGAGKSDVKAKIAERLGAYQEWAVTAAQKLSSLSSRTKLVDYLIAVDRQLITVSRKESKRVMGAQQTSVAVFKREMTSLASIEVVQGDAKSFKLTWKNPASSTSDLPSVYQCANTKDCSDIINKLKGILDLLS